jgi:hypothetical protein
VAKGFRVDTAKAQQVGDRLTSIGKTIAAFPPGPQARGQLGSGVIEQAWSQLEQALTTARQNLTRSIEQSAQGFTGLSKGALDLDQQQAQHVETL